MKYKNILYFLIIVFNIMSTADTSKLTDMVASIANSVYKHDFVTSVVWWPNHRDNATDFLVAFNGSYVSVPIRKGKSPKIRGINKAVGFYQTVFFTSTPEQFWYWIRSLYKDIVTPIQVLLVIIEPIIHQSELIKYTRTAWKNDVADFVIVSASDDEDNDITLSTYFPYGNGICGDYTPVALDLNVNIENIFPNKFNNFYGCPVRATVLEYLPYLHLNYVNDTIIDITAIDGKFATLVFESLNATLNIVSVVEQSGMESYSNGSIIGPFGDLLNRKSDIFIPADIINNWRYSKTQISPVFRTYEIAWSGPMRREIYAWAKIILPFFTSITPFICLSFVVFITVTMIVNKFDLRKPKLKDSVLFQSFTIFLGQDTKFMTNSPLVNSLFVLWIWFCLVVRIGYQGDLVDGLRKVILEPPLGSVEEAITKVDGYGGIELYKEYYVGSPLEENYQVLQLEEMLDYLIDISHGKRFLLAMNTFVNLLYYVELQVSHQSISRPAVYWFMRPGWPASVNVFSRIHLLIETGFLERIVQVYTEAWCVIYRYTEKIEIVVDPLGMSVFGALFYALAALWFVCSVVFIVEIAYFKYKTRQQFISS